MLEKWCDGSHEHEAWGVDPETGVFNTSKEAEYPRPLCEAYADVLEMVTASRGQHPRALSDDKSKARAMAQPRGRKFPQLISEYKRCVSVKSDSEPSLDGKKCLNSAFCNVPAGSKLLRTEARGDSKLYVFGVFRSMEEFVLDSRQLWHPYDELVNLPDALIKCIFWNLTLSPHELTKWRIDTLRRWSKMAMDLKKEESELKSKLHPKVRKCLGAKRLLLLEALAKQVGWEDENIHSDLRSGFKLTGYCPPTGIFERECKPAVLDKPALMRQALFIRPMILGKMGTHSINDDDKELYEITVREATEKGWLEGPYGVDYVSKKFQNSWLPVRRFGVRQKNKLRPIDDMKENRLNESFTCNDKIDLKSLDQILWSIFVLIRCCTFHNEVHFRLKSGEELHGRVESTWKSQGTNFKATTFDLESAYKQLPLHPEEQDCSVVSIVDPQSREIACFLMNTLPFGSVASVLHFNRVSRLLWRLGLEMGILWTNYFDDYPCVSHSLHEKSTMSSVKGLFELLGYAYAKDKLLDFSGESEMLGIKLDLSGSISGVVVVDNKESRKNEMAELLGKILETKKVVPSELPSTLGKLQYADMQVSGRTGKLAMCDIRAIGYNGSNLIDISHETCLAFEMLRKRLLSGKPKRFEVSVMEKPIVIFTDGAFERDETGMPVATIGGVCLPPSGDVKVFGCHIDEDILRSWLDKFEHPVGLVELYGVATAFVLWSQHCNFQRVIFFCDNWTSLDVFVKGSSNDPMWREVLLSFEACDFEYSTVPWIARVPSSSNVADLPSRGSLEPISFLKPFRIVEAKCPISGRALRSLFG